MKTTLQARYSVTAKVANNKYTVEVTDTFANCTLILTQEPDGGDCLRTEIFFDTENYVEVEQISPRAGKMTLVGEWESNTFFKLFAKAQAELEYIKNDDAGVM